MLVTVASGYAQDDRQFTAKADEGKREAPSVEQITIDMINHLGLDNDQAAKLKELNTEYADVVSAPGPRGRFGHPERRGDGPRMRPAPEGDQQQTPPEGVQKVPKLDGQKLQTGDGQQRQRMDRRDNPQREQMRARRAEYHQKLEKILNADQLEKLHSMRPGPRPRQ